MLNETNYIKKGKTNIDKVIDKMLPFAIDFYGKDKEDIIKKKIEETFFYSWTDETSLEIINYLVGSDSLLKYTSNSKNNDDQVDAFYFSNNNRKVVIYKDLKQEINYFAFAHELFFHSVCQSSTNGGNGIFFAHKNIYANEGWADLVARRITDSMRMNVPLYKNQYFLALFVASIIEKNTDSSIISDMLVKQKYNIEDIFNLGKCDDWKELSLLLDSVTKENYSSTEVKVKKYLNNYKKRVVTK